MRIDIISQEKNATVLPNKMAAVRILYILGLQPFPRECENKDMTAMLAQQQNGGYDVTCNRRTHL
jgi:hypothetical protein